MRVLHWYPNFLGGGGIANAVLGLTLSEARLGAQVGIAAAKQSGPPLYEAMDCGGSVTLFEWEPSHTLRNGGIFARWIPRDEARALRAFRPDIVHVHGEFNPDNLWVPRLFRCPVVLSPHGGFHPIVFTKSRRVAKRLYFSAVRHLFYRRVDALHALSRIEREHLVRLFPGAMVYCAPLGPNVRTRLSLPESGEQRSNEGVRFAFVGRLDVFTKGLDSLLEAFADVEHRLRGHRQITLTIVGPDWGGGRAWLERRKHQLGITSRVDFTGAVSGEEVARTLHRSDIYVHLSRYEGYALSITEALCAGKPTILSAAVGHVSYPEITCLPHVRVVPPDAKAAAAAMTDFALRLGELKVLAERNRPKIQTFCSWERVAGVHLEIYERIGRGRAAVSRQPRSPGWPLPPVTLTPNTSCHRHGSPGR